MPPQRRTCRLRAQGPRNALRDRAQPLVPIVFRISKRFGELRKTRLGLGEGVGSSSSPWLAVGQPQVNEILPPLVLPPFLVSSPLCLGGRSTGHGPV